MGDVPGRAAGARALSQDTRDDKRTARQRLGDAAEEACAAHLLAQGLKPIERKARFREGEIDLILLHADTLVFCEVRYRSSTTFGGGLGSVDIGKCRRLAAAAQRWLDGNRKHAARAMRFDVVEVSGVEPNFVFDWRQDAFRMDELR